MNVAETPVVEWLQIIRGEYHEIPGLRLTREQAQRLWSLEPDVCDILLEALEDEGFLRRTPDGYYARADIG
jgi:hypothetical protein